MLLMPRQLDRVLYPPKEQLGPQVLMPVPGEDYVLLTSLLPMPYVNHWHSALNVYAQSILTQKFWPHCCPVGSSP